MNPLIPPLALLPLVAFYLWMFRDMTRNDRLTAGERYSWTWAFLLLNVFAAALYYVNEYRSRW